MERHFLASPRKGSNNQATSRDKKSDVSFYILLSAALRDAALKDIKLFKHGSAGDVRKLVAEAKASNATYQPTLDALLRKRNWTQAHFDWRAFWHGHSQMLYKFLREQASQVTDDVIEALFEETRTIFNKFCVLESGRAYVGELGVSEEL